jgi:pyruvate dehydrogenase E1 component beta subunit
MKQATFREAVRTALRQALRADPRCFLMGEDVGRYGGAYACSLGLLEEFGEERIRDTPLSESAFVGAGIGAAMAGLRPIVEVMTVNFSLLALDQIVNNAATLRHMSAGQVQVPLLIRMATGAGRQLAAQHSHSLENWYASVPGLRVFMPGTVQDARDMILAALREDDPVIVFEHQALYPAEGPFDPDAPARSARAALVRRPGRDLTLLAWGGCLPRALAAAEVLSRRGIEAEVVDLRCLRPLDRETVQASVRRTRRLLVADEGWRTGSLAGELVAQIAETTFHELDAPPARVCTAEVPIPYARHLEAAALPSVDRIVAAAEGLERPRA